MTHRLAMMMSTELFHFCSPAYIMADVSESTLLLDGITGTAARYDCNQFYSSFWHASKVLLGVHYTSKMTIVLLSNLHL